MTSKIQKAIIGGIAGTVAMTMVTLIAPMLGIPKMSPPAMLSMMMGFPIAIGWLMHFMIGIIFAIMYAFILINVLKKVSNNILKGAIFGMFAFVFGQIMIAVMGMMFPMPPMEGSMMLMTVGSIIGHLVFGIVSVQFIKEPVEQKSFA